ncbi:hypothetical protein FCV25MIE_04976, partial [Fagus crenata]
WAGARGGGAAGARGWCRRGCWNVPRWSGAVGLAQWAGARGGGAAGARGWCRRGCWNGEGGGAVAGGAGAGGAGAGGTGRV